MKKKNLTSEELKYENEKNESIVYRFCLYDHKHDEKYLEKHPYPKKDVLLEIGKLFVVPAYEEYIIFKKIDIIKWYNNFLYWWHNEVQPPNTESNDFIDIKYSFFHEFTHFATSKTFFYLQLQHHLLLFLHKMEFYLNCLNFNTFLYDYSTKICTDVGTVKKIVKRENIICVNNDFVFFDWYVIFANYFCKNQEINSFTSRPKSREYTPHHKYQWVPLYSYCYNEGPSYNMPTCYVSVNNKKYKIKHVWNIWEINGILPDSPKGKKIIYYTCEGCKKVSDLKNEI